MQNSALPQTVAFFYDSTQSKRLKSKVTQRDIQTDKIYLSVATSAEPRNRKEIALRKFNCLNEVSFEFLGICSLFLWEPDECLARSRCKSF